MAGSEWQGLVQLGPYPEPLANWSLDIEFSSEVDLVESAAASVSGAGLEWCWWPWVVV